MATPEIIHVLSAKGEALRVVWDGGLFPAGATHYKKPGDKEWTPLCAQECYPPDTKPKKFGILKPALTLFSPPAEEKAAAVIPMRGPDRPRKAPDIAECLATLSGLAKESNADRVNRVVQGAMWRLAPEEIHRVRLFVIALLEARP